MSLKIIDGSEIEHNMSDKITIVNFYADWCGPCQMMQREVFSKMAEKDHMTILKINIDKNRETAQKYNVQGIPSTFVYKNKKLKFQETGFIPEKILEEKIAKL